MSIKDLKKMRTLYEEGKYTTALLNIDHVINRMGKDLTEEEITELSKLYFLKSEVLNAMESPYEALEMVKVSYHYKKDIENISFLAHLNNSLGNYEESIKYLEEVSKEGRDDEWIYSEKGWTLNALGRSKEALENLLRAKELGRKDPWIFNELGTTYRILQRKKESLDILYKGLEISGGWNKDIIQNIGITLYELKDYKQSLRWLSKFETLNENENSIIIEYLIKNNIELEKFQQVENLISDLKNIDFIIYLGDYLLHKNLQQVYFNCLESIKEKRSLFLAKIRIEQCRALEGLESDNIDNETMLAKAKEALVYCEQYAKNNLGVKNDLYYEIGFCLTRLKRYHEGWNYLVNAKIISTNEKEVQKIDEELIKNLNNHVKDSKEKINKNQLTPTLLYELGFALIRLGRQEEGLEYLLKAEKQGNHSYDNYSEIICTFYNLERYTETLEYIKKVDLKDMNENNLNLHMFFMDIIGQSFFELKIYQEAIVVFETLISLGQENNPKLLMNLGDCYREVKRYQDSIKYFLKAKKISKPKAKIYYELGRLYGRLNEHKKALEILSVAKKLAETDFELELITESIVWNTKENN
ncbi:tetratricopeptide repeat protein [Psychrilyobacter atlanticus]|uniref:tetratricopeptide repeat protein n=1 Tax=Psychrilyobacter atlanticus TaxID=271091 RepID=UPI000428BF8E|nr:tetratricopeptide repeat protein [Psychrilyobacter atlanticus]